MSRPTFLMSPQINISPQCLPQLLGHHPLHILIRIITNITPIIGTNTMIGSSVIVGNINRSFLLQQMNTGVFTQSMLRPFCKPNDGIDIGDDAYDDYNDDDVQGLMPKELAMNLSSIHQRHIINASMHDIIDPSSTHHACFT